MADSSHMRLWSTLNVASATEEHNFLTVLIVANLDLNGHTGPVATTLSCAATHN